MAASPSFCDSCSPPILRHRTTDRSNTASSSSSCSPSASSSCHHSSNSMSFSGIKFLWKSRSLQTRATSTMHRNLSLPGTLMDVEEEPDHLLVLVHGIWASPDDWTYFEGELKRQLGKTFLIYASSSNTYTKTLTGIDDSGRRLADEVLQVVKNTQSLRKISFLAHSLGGLIARYAIGVLYKPDVPSHQPHDVDSSTATNKTSCSSSYGLVAGLEPFNFITLATPHLGVRGNKQVKFSDCSIAPVYVNILNIKGEKMNMGTYILAVELNLRGSFSAKLQLPFLLGLPFLEKIAAPIAPIFVGRTGSQLFLTDGKPNKRPLLLRMASDSDDGHFISALGAFRSRVTYANVLYDHMVGWRTSSIRRETELAQPPSQSLDGYKHVVKVEFCPPILSETPNFLPEAAKAKEAAQSEPSTENTVKYHEIMEEEMIRGLQRLGWTKVDVNFHSALWRFSAHSSIHVKNERLHKAGAGVLAHVAETIKQQDPKPCIEAIIKQNNMDTVSL